MSWSDEELDKLFKSAADTQKVTYKDSYWDEMNALLGAEKKRKGVFWWWLTGTGVTVGIFITAFLMWNTESNDSKLIAKNQSTNEFIEENTVVAHETVTETDEDKLVQKEIETYSTDGLEAQLSSNNTNQNDATLITENKINKGSNELVNTAKNELANEDKNESILNNAGKKNDQLLGDNLVIEQSNTQTEDLSQLEEIVNEVEQIDVDQIDERNNYTISTNYPYSQIGPIDYRFTPRRKIGFYTELNGGMAQSYLITETNNWGYTANVGAGIEYYQNAWQFAGGVGFRLEHYSNIIRHYERNVYSFGLVQEAQDNSYDQFLRFEVPVSVAYSIKKFEIRAGVTPSYLFAARNQKNLNTNNSIGFNTFEKNEETISEFVQSDYFKPFGLQSQLGIGYAIMPKLTLNINTSFHLINPIQVDHFIGEFKSNPMAIEIGLRKRF